MKTYYKFSTNYRQTLIYLDEDMCGVLNGGDSPYFGHKNSLTAADSNVFNGCPFNVNLIWYINIFSWLINHLYFTCTKSGTHLYTSNANSIWLFNWKIVSWQLATRVCRIHEKKWPGCSDGHFKFLYGS